MPPYLISAVAIFHVLGISKKGKTGTLPVFLFPVLSVSRRVTPGDGRDGEMVF